MIIVKTTDNQHLGIELQLLNIAETVVLNGFIFEVQKIVVLENGNTFLSNPNYQIECQEQ